MKHSTTQTLIPYAAPFIKTDAQRRITLALSILLNAAVVVGLLASGCVDPDPKTGDDVDLSDVLASDNQAYQQTDPAPSAPTSLNLVFGGPLGGTEIGVGASGVNVLCFSATATEKDMQIRNFRIELTSADGLVIGMQTQYGDVRVFDGSTLVAGPAELSNDSLDTTQALVLPSLEVLAADVTRHVCVKLDVNLDDLLDGNTLYVKLLPFEAGDVVLIDDGSELPTESIEPAAGLWTVLTVRGIQGPSVPMAAPTVSHSSVPTNVLTVGTNIAYRMTITAPVASDVLIKKLSFSFYVASSGDPSVANLYNARLRVLGSSMPLGGWTDVLWYSGDCGFAATWTHRCVRVFLDQPLAIDAGTSVTVDLLIDFSGAPTAGDMLAIGAAMDGYGHQEGPLTGGPAPHISGGYEDSMLWSDDGLWWYNGHSVNWGAPFAQTLTY